MMAAKMIRQAKAIRIILIILPVISSIAFFFCFDNELNYLLSNWIVETTCGLNAGNKFISVCADLSEQTSYWIKIYLTDFWRLPDRAMKLGKEILIKRNNLFGRLVWNN